jgi:hypothetical protein
MTTDKRAFQGECPFKLGDAIVWTPDNFNPKFWENTPLEDRDRYYYSWTMDSRGNPIVFVFITEINQAPGHCVVVSMAGGKVEWMRHTTEFRLATEDEV